MVDISAIGSALVSLKAAKDIAESMVGLRDAKLFQEKQIEFQSKIIDANNAAFAAQEERTAILEEIDQLKKQIAELEAWKAEKQRYQLTDFGAGTFAYELKPEMEQGEPPHRICPNCYQQDKKSILQFQNQTAFSQDLYRCPSCKTDFSFGEPRTPSPYTTRPSSWTRR